MRQQGADVAVARGRQAREHFAQPCVRVMAVGLGGRQQAHDRRGAAPGSLVAGEQPVLAPQRHRPDRVLDRIVVARVAAVVQAAGQRRPAPQCLVDCGQRPWLCTYNHERPNMALDDITSMQELAMAA